MSLAKAIARAVAPFATIVAGLAGATAAHAESVTMHGRFAPDYPDAARARTLAIGRFTGADGPQLGNAIERLLSRPDLSEGTYFDLVAATPGGRGRADAVLTGDVSTGIDESRYTRTEEKCVERENGKRDGKCVREEDVRVHCTRRTIDLTASLRMVNVADGGIVYSVSRPRRDEASWCKGERQPCTVEAAIRAMVGDVAAEVRRDIAPREEQYSIRFRESRKDLPRALGTPFKDAVRLSQTDLAAACDAWADIDRQSPGHPSVQFDLGLCAESNRDYPLALQRFRYVRDQLGIREADDDVRRVEDLLAGRELDRARAR